MPAKALPPIFESKETINNRTRLYLRGKHELLSAGLKAMDENREETRWVWFSKENVEMWLEEMNDLGADGMRIYLGEKETDEEDALNPGNQMVKAAGQLCLLVVLTRPGSVTDSHINIIYENEADFSERFALYEAIKNGNTDKQFNFGGYCPPMSVTEGDDYPNDSIT